MAPPPAENLKSVKSKRKSTDTQTSARKLKAHDSQKSELKENEKIDINPEQVYDIHNAHANSSCFCDVCMIQHNQERFKNTQKHLSDVQ